MHVTLLSTSSYSLQYYTVTSNTGTPLSDFSVLFNFGIKDVCRWVLEHEYQHIFNFAPPPTPYCCSPKDFRGAFLRNRGCFWTPPLDHQKTRKRESDKASNRNKEPTNDRAWLTVAFETLMYEPVEQRAAVVTECRAAVRVQLELVPVRSLRTTRLQIPEMGIITQVSN